MSSIWINRILALILYCTCIFICEKFKLSPIACFLLATFYIIGLSFLFEFIKEVLK